MCCEAMRPMRVLWHASAGHEPAYLLRGADRVETLSSTGPVLGFQEAGLWESARIESHPGDRLVIVTDGLAEARNAAGELFGKDRLLAAMREAVEAGKMDSFPAAVMSQVRAFQNDAPQTDDMTVLVLAV